LPSAWPAADADPGARAWPDRRWRQAGESLRPAGPEGEGAGAAAPPTVYRALDFLLANGFIHKLESVNAFVACHHPSTAQHSVPFLICDRCHSAVELEDEQVVAALDERARALGFVPQAQTLEVHGLCARCSG
jgi:Fur family zinc uptake transcriptional regulator